MFVRILEILPCRHMRTAAKRDKEICLTESENLNASSASGKSMRHVRRSHPNRRDAHRIFHTLLKPNHSGKVRSRHVELLQQFEANLRSEAWTLAASNIETMSRFERLFGRRISRQACKRGRRKNSDKEFTRTKQATRTQKHQRTEKAQACAGRCQ